MSLWFRFMATMWASLVPLVLFAGDPLLVTEKDMVNISSSPEYAENQELIQRLTNGIYNWKTNHGESPWWFCGKKAPNPKEKAMMWAYQIVTSANMVGAAYSFPLNPWGIAGTISRESAFDECALGLYPRLWAYENGLLRRKKQHISHSRKEIDRLVRDKKFLKRWPAIDFGPGQLMWKSVYKGPLDPLLSVSPGVRLVVMEMGRRIARYRSIWSRRVKNRPWEKQPWWFARPWAFWQGKLSETYDSKVVKRARLLGATKQELGYKK